MAHLGDTIPDFVAAMRRKRGWTQEHLAVLLGADCRQYVSGVERGVRPSAFGFCFLLLDYCDRDEAAHLLRLAKRTARSGLISKRRRYKT